MSTEFCYRTYSTQKAQKAAVNSLARIGYNTFLTGRSPDGKYAITFVTAPGRFNLVVKDVEHAGIIMKGDLL